MFVDVHKPNYEVNAGYFDVSPFYDPIDGFTTNSDIHGPQGFFNFDGSTTGIKNWALFIGGDRFLDNSGAVHQADTQIFFNATFKNGFSINGAGAAIGQLRSYGVPAGPDCSGPIVSQTSFSGYPCYLDGTTQQFNLSTIPIGYGDGTPRPIDVSYSWGPFGGNETHLFDISTSRPLGRRMTLGLEYSGTYERPLAAPGALDSQWLRRVSIGYNLGPESTLTISFRNINGLGGFSTQPGTNVAVGFPRALSRRQRTLRELRLSGRKHDAQSHDNEIRFPRRGGRRHVAFVVARIALGMFAILPPCKIATPWLGAPGIHASALVQRPEG